MAGGFFGGAGGRGDARAGRTERDTHPGGCIPGVAADRSHGAGAAADRGYGAAVIRRGARPAAGQCFT
ncbi:hypothetical protein MAHJHV53_04210 [Mycobacterium avium subsp. hominissuis]|uniref:Uncharacterized protein n=1 Tax=Mycobacterium timonense TaxID=701043 RepID=A0ABX3TG28_9MYCO|nr:hypothetical protein BST46_22755 [Mycobacterium timonense]